MINEALWGVGGVIRFHGGGVTTCCSAPRSKVGEGLSSKGLDLLLLIQGDKKHSVTRDDLLTAGLERSRGQQSLSLRSLFLLHPDSDKHTHTHTRTETCLRSHACSSFTVLMYGRLRVEPSVSFNGLSKPPVQPLTGSATLHKSSLQTQPTPVKQRRPRTALICAGWLPTAAARLQKKKSKKRHNKQSHDFRTLLHDDEQINKNRDFGGEMEGVVEG